MTPLAFEKQDGASAVICVAIVIAVDEARSDFSQIARSDRPIAANTGGLWARRSAIHHDESHVPPPDVKQDAVSATRRSGISNFGKNLTGASPRSLSGGVKSTQPCAITFLACPEAINAFLRADGGSPGVVLYETEFSVADRAPLGCAVPGMLANALHCCLLWILRGW